MKRFTFLLVVVLVAAFALAPVAAQDDNMGEMVTCDSDLILAWYIADYYFNFAAVHDMLMMDEGDDAMMTDYSVIDKGQFAPLFDSMMSMMDDGMMMPESMMSEEMLSSVMDTMMMSEEEMMSMMPEGEMTMLQPADMMDEPEVCSSLRGDLRSFFTAVAYQNMMMSDDSM